MVVCVLSAMNPWLSWGLTVFQLGRLRFGVEVGEPGLLAGLEIQHPLRDLV